MRKTSGQGTFQATSVPEPATLILTAIGAFGLLFYRRRPAGRRASRPTRVWNLLEYARRNPTMTLPTEVPGGSLGKRGDLGNMRSKPLYLMTL